MEPLPLAEVENNYSEEEQDLFMTPRMPSYVSRLNNIDHYWPQSPRSISASPAPDSPLVLSSALLPAQAALGNVNDLIISEELLQTCATKRRKDLPTSQDQAEKRKLNTLLNYFDASQK